MPPPSTQLCRGPQYPLSAPSVITRSRPTEARAHACVTPRPGGGSGTSKSPREVARSRVVPRSFFRPEFVLTRFYPSLSGTCPSTHGEAILTEIADSYVCGVADAPLLGNTIGRSLDLAARRWADREALVSPSHGVRWTWKELAERVDALAAGFLALGLEPGARIGIWSLNRPEWTLTQFAAARAGLILVTINPAYRLSELEFVLAKVGFTALVTATA